MAKYRITNPTYKRMHYQLTESIRRRGVAASWMPTAAATVQPLQGCLSYARAGAGFGPAGRERDLSAEYVVSREAFDEAETFPIGGVLTVEGDTFRVSEIVKSFVSVRFILGESGV